MSCYLVGEFSICLAREEKSVLRPASRQSMVQALSASLDLSWSCRVAASPTVLQTDLHDARVIVEIAE